MTAPTVTLVQLTLPGYRVEFVRALRESGQVVIAAGHEHLDPTITRGVPDEHIDVDLRNVFLFGRRLAFQTGVWRALRPTRFWVLELNPRIITTWVYVVLARLTRRRVYLWGHYLGRRHGETVPRLGRRLQVRLAHGVLAYTEADAARFRQWFPRSRVVVAPNAVDRADQVPPASAGPRRHFLTIGRLTPGKHVDLIVAAFAEACRSGRLPTDTRLVIVGSGPSEPDVRRAVERSSIADRIDLLPGTFDRDVLEGLYTDAIAGVCGGYVGLNITQSLVRGVPFVYPLVSNHSPEVSLARPGHNAWPFDPSTSSALADALVDAWRAVNDGVVDPAAIQSETLSVYTAEKMAEGLLGVTRA